jgi:DNA-binding transcriptional ArsR family regulator
MTRVCTICSHQKRDEIERILVDRSESYRDIARRFGVSKDAVSRHVNQGHIAERLLKARDEEDVRAALNVTQQLKTINAVAVGILREARDGGDPGTALRAIDRIHRQLELQAKLLGDLDERPVINILLSSEWIELRAVIVGALDAHPDARESVLRALEGAASGRA